MRASNFFQLSLVTEERIPTYPDGLPPSDRTPPPSSTPFRLSLTNMLTRGRLLARKKREKEAVLSISLPRLSCSFARSLFPPRYSPRSLLRAVSFPFVRTSGRISRASAPATCAPAPHPLDRRQGHPCTPAAARDLVKRIVGT